jgi:hypothetical protein
LKLSEAMFGIFVLLFGWVVLFRLSRLADARRLAAAKHLVVATRCLDVSSASRAYPEAAVLPGLT